MPITPQAKKAIRRDAQHGIFNLRSKRTMKDAVKEVRDLATAGKTKEAADKLPDAYKAIDKAAKRNIIHKNAAARKKSRLSKLLTKQ